ncbi:hypothetical protein [Acinetobacter seifertii]|uniref:hypothetical protein n=1 Tax=Acinetobacter seifertii TaxID=1530123 RepID=UPI0019054CAF|nr:hypothetical protein [Acinetobacter seifertii]MBJ9425156.1 hypothetical protein [Acinetobacter seifertii]
MAYKLPAEPQNTPSQAIKYQNKSQFGKINEHLIVRIRRCDKNGNLLEDADQVTSLGIDGELTIENQYSTPFENSNPEQKLPTLMGQLQSGNWVETLDSVLGSIGIEMSADKKESLNSLAGRSNLTKENSTQIFVSTGALTLPLSLHFEAWADAKTEVEDQLDLLKQWTLPESLSDQSLLASFAQDKSLQSLFPSLVPPFVAVYYGGKRYAPLLIQSYSEPLTTPKDEDGNRMFVSTQVTFLSRQAWDKNNISSLYSE